MSPKGLINELINEQNICKKENYCNFPNSNKIKDEKTKTNAAEIILND